MKDALFILALVVVAVIAFTALVVGKGGTDADCPRSASYCVSSTTVVMQK